MPKRETPRPCDGCGEKPRERGAGRRYCSDCSIGCAEHGAYKSSCGQCENVRRRKPWNQKRQLRATRKMKYGLTEEQLDHVDSVDKCEVCGSTTKLCVDHNHKTDEYRGVLCGNCNRAAGLMGDDVERLMALASYLKERGSYGG
jgi:hypothetical protein